MDPPLPVVKAAEDDYSYHDVDEPSAIAIGSSMNSSEEGSAINNNTGGGAGGELGGPTMLATAASTSIEPPAMGAFTSIPTSSEATTSEEIRITEQDVLFGRGGLTNHHIGNLRYRDVIELHRQDYVNSPKTEKPNVARRIVKALRTGPNPGRFLKKDADGKWHEVNDREAAWKASQALREKTRWASMKKDKEGSTISDVIMSSAMIQVVEAATTNAVKSTKRAATDTEQETEEESKGNNDAKSNTTKAKWAKYEHREPVDVVPTEASHIAVPPVASPEGKKSGTVYLQPQSIDGITYIIPQDEDVLFGRGGRTNNHPGNVRLREIVDQYRHIYAQAKKIDKPNVSKLIVGALRGANPPSRFLRMNDETSRWEDVGDRRAAEKVSQTLREKDRSAYRKRAEGDDDNDDDDNVVSDNKPAADPTSEASDETTAFEVNDGANRSDTKLEVDVGAEDILYL